MGRVTKDLWGREESHEDDYEEPHDDRYRVGYRKPPRHTQFKKGSSGNPRGRPRGGKSATSILGKALSEEIIATVNGRKRKLSKYEALIIRLVNKALEGDYRAIEYLLVKMPVLKTKFAETEKPGGLSPEAAAAIRRALGISPRKRVDSPASALGNNSVEEN